MPLMQFTIAYTTKRTVIWSFEANEMSTYSAMQAPSRQHVALRTIWHPRTRLM